MWMRITITLLSAVLLASCSGGAAQKTGFLRNYAQLKPDPDIKGALSYRAPNLYSYRKFLIDPVMVHFAPNAKGTAIDPAALQELTYYFRKNTIKALSKNYQVVDRPGPGVLRFRIAITNIVKTVPLLNIHPAMKLSGAGLGGASMEAEGIDTQTGKRVAAIVETAAGNRLSVGAGLSRYGHAKQVMDGWIERFVGRLDATWSSRKR